MKTIIKKSLMGLCLSSLLFSGACTNLDETLYGEINDTNIDLTNDKDMMAMVGAIVAQYRYLIMGDWFPLGQLLEESGDQYVVPARVSFGWGDAYINLHKHDWGVEVGQIQAPYDRAFLGIAYANQVLDNLDENNPEHTKAICQAKFFRALFYYHLFDMVGNPPMQTTQNVPAGYLPKQIGIEGTYNWIVDELNWVKENIGDFNAFGWGNRYAVNMTLAKLYLNKNSYFEGHVPGYTPSNDGYEKALAEVEEIIQSGKYSLAPNYLDNFKEKIESCPEIIFANPGDRTHAKHYGWNAFNLSETSIKAYDTTCAAYGAAANGVPQFIRSYDADDKRLADSWLGGTVLTAVKNSDGTYTPNSGSPIPYDVHDWSGTGVLTYNIECHSVDKPGCFMQEGYHLVKYEVVCGSTFGSAANDQVIYRYADALMIKAECLLRLGRDEQTAADLVTQVRKRSFSSTNNATRTVAQLKGGSVYAYGHDEYTTEDENGYNDWSNHVYTYEGGDDIEFGGLLDDLGWEFVGEFHRRQDLRRFKMADGRNVWNGKSWFCKDATDTNTYDWYCIPSEAIKANKELEPTPGYLYK